MPTYGYRCRTCGNEFEILQKMSDAPLKTCPKCSGELQKLVYPTGVIFKGSGFYKTDYKSASSGSGESGSNGSKSSSEKPGEAKPSGEAKAEPKTESKTAKSDSDS
jgi:putative FmdB family regulatory protein